MNEPEALRQIKEVMDSNQAMRIFADLKWTLKMYERSWTEVAQLIEQSIQRCHAEITSPEVKFKAVKGFTVMLERARQFIDEGVEPAKCPKCNLSTFICPCPKEQ